MVFNGSFPNIDVNGNFPNIDVNCCGLRINMFFTSVATMTNCFQIFAVIVNNMLIFCILNYMKL